MGGRLGLCARGVGSPSSGGGGGGFLDELLQVRNSLAALFISIFILL